ncbi:MAG: cation-translocating P-type ATPase [Henriciella sp.]
MTSAVITPELGCPSGLSPASVSDVGDFAAFVKTKGTQQSLALSVRGAKCGGCLSKIEKSINTLPGVIHARMNLSNGRLLVTWTGRLPAKLIADQVSALGYGVFAFSEDDHDKVAKQDERELLISMGIAGFAAANIMLLSVSVWGGHGEMGAYTRTGLHALSGMSALPVLVYSGRHFFRSAYKALKVRRANMDVPISLALILAFGVSAWETAQGGAHAYFDASVMLLFFLLIGRFLDARLRRQAHAAAHDLAALQNRSVNRVTPGGKVETVKADAIRAGDEVLLAAGERAMIDLRVSDGNSSVDESLVTGESLPRLLQTGDVLYAGTVNLDQPLRARALGEASDSLLSGIARMLDAGEQKKANYRKIADKAVSLYVPFVHTTAALTFVTWMLLGASVRDAILIAVATLIITCPCALALAAPVVQVVASGRLFRKGVYLKSGDALERFAEVDHIVFDKTGTLTLGAPQLVSPHGEALQQAAHLARASRHPLSRAIVHASGPGPLAEGVSETPGKGIEGTIEGKTYRLGSAEWAGVDPAPHNSGPTLWFSGGGRPPVQFLFQDQVQSGAKLLLGQLQKQSFGLEILSGDLPASVASTASELSIQKWAAKVSPQDKVARLEALRGEDRKVLMVGDGLNDAGALAMAHASLAPGGAMDISQAASDAVYSGGLASILTILQVSKRARAIMLQNFGLAAAYNLVAVPIAVTGNVTPLVAAIAMSASSLIVTLNALRLNFGDMK